LNLLRKQSALNSIQEQKLKVRENLRKKNRINEMFNISTSHLRLLDLVWAGHTESMGR